MPEIAGALLKVAEKEERAKDTAKSKATAKGMTKEVARATGRALMEKEDSHSGCSTTSGAMNGRIRGGVGPRAKNPH